MVALRRWGRCSWDPVGERSLHRWAAAPGTARGTLRVPMAPGTRRVCAFTGGCKLAFQSCWYPARISKKYLLTDGSILMQKGGR